MCCRGLWDSLWGGGTRGAPAPLLNEVLFIVVLLLGVTWATNPADPQVSSSRALHCEAGLERCPILMELSGRMTGLVGKSYLSLGLTPQPWSHSLIFLLPLYC